ncbi:amidase [Streptomyces sp. NPDC005811]|uniref:amidase n=1 Tax=Streptomyces sp. NPDC005811 TaxID=3154565 RepID=UPI0033E0DAF0
MEALARIARLDPSLSSFAEVWEEAAVERARAVDARVAAGEPLPLAGVPIGVKGRHGLRAAGPLLAAGCVPVGSTSVPGPGTPWQTWGVGAYGRTVNPWRADRTPGGSSAGSAAAVAAGLVPLATGSDGAGSVRIPAAWCGVIGLKTTNGRLPSPDRTGLAAPGVLVRHAADAAAYWRAMTGAVPGAPSGEVIPGEVVPGEVIPEGVTRERAIREEATPEEAMSEAAMSSPVTAVFSADLGFASASPDPEPLALARAAVGRLAASGVVRLLPGEAAVRLEDPAPAWLALRGSGAGGLGEAGRVREVNDRRLAALFARADLLLTPATPNAAHGHDGPGERYSTALTWAFNLSGHPAVSLPAGVGADGCPVGVQLVAARGREETLLAVVRAAERAGALPLDTCMRI